MVDSLTAPAVLTSTAGNLSARRDNDKNVALQQDNASPTTESPLTASLAANNIGTGNVLDVQSSNSGNSLIGAQSAENPVQNLFEEASELDPIASLQEEISSGAAVGGSSALSASPLQDLQSTSSFSNNSAISGGSTPADTLRDFIGTQSSTPGSIVDLEV